MTLMKYFFRFAILNLMANDWMSLRASQDDRVEVEAHLQIAYREGRLDLSEFEDRLERVHRSVTYSDLMELVVDLPKGEELVQRLGGYVAESKPLAMMYPTYPSEPQRRLVGGGSVAMVALAIFMFPILTTLMFAAAPALHFAFPLLAFGWFFGVLRMGRRSRRRSRWYR
ncbi:protein of unknown function [Ferrithrix thermotolerans DSM 19514]|uniref:DUF1707 domain-containing protein n=2 Tax=Ferrithrix TaxID=643949 RepID=A0A1M4S5P4_9ACTN|nr:protein of unknown function [Ferrithrix thermotolerans DSM 19514]